MSKSGLFDHFGSKQELELATVERAIAILRREVVEPAAAVEPGLARLRALVDGYLAYLERDTLPGGCFLTAAGAEFDEGEARYGTRSRRRAAPGEGSSRRRSSSPARGTSSQQTPNRRRSSSSSARSRRERTRSISSTTTAARSRGRAPIARLLG